MAQTDMYPVLPVKTKLILSVKWNVANKQSVKKNPSILKSPNKPPIFPQLLLLKKADSPQSCLFVSLFF